MSPTGEMNRLNGWFGMWLLLFVAVAFAPSQARASFTKSAFQTPEVIALPTAPQVAKEPRFKLEITTGILCGNDPVNRHDPLGLKDFTGPDGILDPSLAHGFLEHLDMLTTDFPAQVFRSLVGLPGQVNQGMAQARLDIDARIDSGEYGPGTAAMARGLQFMGSISAGVTMAPLQPVDTTVGIVTAPVVLPYNLGSSIRQFGADPSLSGGFDVFENGLNVAAMFEGGSALQSRFPALQNMRVPSMPRLNPGNYNWNPFSAPFRGGYAYSGVPVPGMPSYRGSLLAGETSLALPSPTFIRHHIFNKFRGKSPGSQKYRDFFKRHGIKVDDYTVEMTETMHVDFIHRGGNNWTTRWRQWIDENPNATTPQVYQFGGSLMDEYGINHFPIIPYR